MTKYGFLFSGISILAFSQLHDCAHANDIDAINKFIKYQKLKSEYGKNYRVFAASEFDPLSQNNALKILAKLQEEINFAEYDRINYSIDGEALDSNKYDIFAIFADLPYELFDNVELWSRNETIEVPVTQPPQDVESVDNLQTEEVTTPESLIITESQNIKEPQTIQKEIRVLNVNIKTHHIVVFASKRRGSIDRQSLSLLRFNNPRNFEYNSGKLITDFSATKNKPVISYGNSTNLDSSGDIENRNLNRSSSQNSQSQFSAIFNDKIGDNDLVIGAKAKTSVFNRMWNYSTLGYNAIGDDGSNFGAVNANNFGTGNNTNSKSELNAAYIFKNNRFDGQLSIASSLNNIDEQYENSYRELSSTNFDVSYSRSRYYEIKSSALVNSDLGKGKLTIGNDYTIRKLSKQSLYGESGSSNMIVALQPSSRTDIEEFLSNIYAKTSLNLAPKLSLDAQLGLVVGNTYNQGYDINNNIVYYVPDIKIVYAKDSNTTLKASFKRDFSNFYYGAFAFLGNVNSDSSLVAEKTNIAEIELQRKFANDIEFNLELSNQFTPNKIGQIPVYSGAILTGQTLANGLDENIANLSARIKYPITIFDDEYQIQSRFDFGVQSYADAFDNVEGGRINTNRRVTEIYLTRNKDNSDFNWGAYYKSSAGSRYYSYDEAVVVPSNSTLGMFVNYNLNPRADFVMEFSTPLNGNNDVIITKYDISNSNIDYINVRPLSDPSVKFTIKSKI